MDTDDETLNKYHIKNVFNFTEICIDFKIFSIPELFMYLMNATASAKDKFDTPTIAQLAIEKDVYDYYKGLSCDVCIPFY